MKKEFLVVKLFVMFGFNYHDPKEFITYICEKAGKSYLFNHLMEKFDYVYDKYGCHAVMQRFFVELDEEMKEYLVDYAINVYGPDGMSSTYKEYKSL